MDFLLTYQLYEKTSLVKLGIPDVVMQDIQKNCAISDNAEWKKILKKNISFILKRNENNLISCVSEDYVCMIFSVDGEYYIDKYTLKDKDNFGGYWEKEQRKQTFVSDLLKHIKKSNYFLLISGEWKYVPYKRRKLKQAEEEFDKETNDFKREFTSEFGVKGDNSLSQFDENLISFENDYSDKYKEFLTIPTMIKKYGRDRVKIAFRLYLKSKKLIEL